MKLPYYIKLFLVAAFLSLTLCSLTTVLAAAPEKPIKLAMWVHGNAVEVEHKDKLVGHKNSTCTITNIPAYNGYFKQGSSSYFCGQARTMNWFHFPITTPVIVDAKRLKLSKVFVLFRTGARVHSVHVWDGNRRIKEFNNLNLDGGYDRITKGNTFVVPEEIYLNYGLTISVGVEFAGDLMSNNFIYFYAAGVDLTE